MKTIEINGKQYQEYGVVMLPTDDISGMVLHSTGIDPFYDIHTDAGRARALSAVENIGGISQHLYITSSEEPKNGDLCIVANLYVEQLDTKFTSKEEINAQWKKIIATSNYSYTLFYKKLIYLPKKLLKFIEYYILEYNRRNIITKVLIEVGYNKRLDWKIKLNENNQLNIFIEEKNQQETLVEAANNFYPPQTEDLICSPKLVRDAFLAGAEYQAEKMYSREEVEKLLINHTLNLRNKENDLGFTNKWIKENLKK
jgi:hypothetical protein